MRILSIKSISSGSGLYFLRTLAQLVDFILGSGKEAKLTSS